MAVVLAVAVALAAAGEPLPRTNCGKTRHWAWDCKALHRQEQAHPTQGEDDKPVLLMAQVCALNDADGEEDALRLRTQVRLDEPQTQVHLGEENGGEGEERQLWYLDSSTSNHMAGDGAVFTELDRGVVGTLKFGDSSRVDI